MKEIILTYIIHYKREKTLIIIMIFFKTRCILLYYITRHNTVTCTPLCCTLRLAPTLVFALTATPFSFTHSHWMMPCLSHTSLLSAALLQLQVPFHLCFSVFKRAMQIFTFLDGIILLFLYFFHSSFQEFGEAAAFSKCCTGFKICSGQLFSQM